MGESTGQWWAHVERGAQCQETIAKAQETFGGGLGKMVTTEPGLRFSDWVTRYIFVQLLKKRTDFLIGWN